MFIIIPVSTGIRWLNHQLNDCGVLWEMCSTREPFVIFWQSLPTRAHLFSQVRMAAKFSFHANFRGVMWRITTVEMEAFSRRLVPHNCWPSPPGDHPHIWLLESAPRLLEFRRRLLPKMHERSLRN